MKLANCQNKAYLSQKAKEWLRQGDSRRRQGSRASFGVGTAKPRQGEKEIRSYEFPSPRLGKSVAPTVGIQVRSYEFFWGKS